MLVIIISVIVAAIIVLMLVAYNRPDNFRMERRITIDVAPEKVFPLINDFHKWKLWSPWERMDTSMNRQYSGSESGIGSIYEWDGNKKVGQGRMEIVESSISESAAGKVFIVLEFIKPFAAKNTTEFILQRGEGATEVIWAMEGKHIFAAKLMCLFMNMDKVVGNDFEAGLQNLKRVVTE